MLEQKWSPYAEMNYKLGKERRGDLPNHLEMALCMRVRQFLKSDSEFPSDHRLEDGVLWLATSLYPLA